MRSLRRTASVTALVLVPLLVFAPAASAKVMTRAGLRVDVPAGYSFAWSKGSYTIRDDVRYVKVTYGRTPLGLRPAANQMATGMKGTLKDVVITSKGRVLSARIVRGKSAFRIRLVRTGMQTTVHLYGRGPRPGAKHTKATDIFGRIVTVADVAVLDRILQSRRGTPRVIPFNLTVPMRQFQAPVTNGASALVPNLPGWQFNGTDTGYLSGGHPSQGSFELGGFLLVNHPSPFVQPGSIVASPTTPAAAIAEVLPQYWRIQSGGTSNVVVTAVQQIPGTDFVLGPNIISGTFQVALTFNGVPWQGLFTVGIGDAVTGISWGTYFSFVAVPSAAPGGVARALVNTWSTWNSDAAVRAGLNRALNTILTTRVPGAPIDPAVFDYTHQLWTDYIRG